MRTQTVREIDDRSRAAGGRIIFSVAVAAAGLSLIIGTWNIYTTERVSLLIAGIFSMMFAGGCMAAIINIIIFFRVGRLDDWYDDDEPPYVPPPRDISDLLDVQNAQNVHSPGSLRLERREGNTVTLGRMGLSRNEWRKLARTLANRKWTWTKRLLEKTDIWGKTLSSYEGKHTRYAIITSEFERLGAVDVERDDNGQIKSAWVTPEGVTEICRLAGTPLL
jgi:hypothetical protein